MRVDDETTRAEPGGLAGFNEADDAELTVRLLTLTAAPQWARQLGAGRPYPGIDEILSRSDEILAGIGADQIDAALDAHPRIGQQAGGLADGSASRSAQEQAGMNSAGAAQAAAQAAANVAYEQRFGRIYLVAATGLSAAELLARAESRLLNDPVAELAVVRSELARITRLRLTDWLTKP